MDDGAQGTGEARGGGRERERETGKEQGREERERESSPRCLGVRTHGDVAVGTHCRTHTVHEYTRTTGSSIYTYIYFLSALSSNESSRFSRVHLSRGATRSRGYVAIARERARFNGTARCHIDRAVVARKRGERVRVRVARRHARNTNAGRTDGTDETEKGRGRERDRERATERASERERVREGEGERERMIEAYTRDGAHSRTSERDGRAHTIGEVHCLGPRSTRRRPGQ